MGLFPHDHKREMAFGDRSVRPAVPRVVGREEKEKMRTSLLDANYLAD